MNYSKEDIVKALEYLTNNYYAEQKGTKKPINVELTDQQINFYDGSSITLSKTLFMTLLQNKLPALTVYYHELGHYLYSDQMLKYLHNWKKKTNQSILQYKNIYAHLLNWIEDYYIEARLKNEYTYLHDILSCLKRIPLPQDKDINDIQFAFHYFYIYNKPHPKLNKLEAKQFMKYLDELLKMRDIRTVSFGNGLVSGLTVKQNVQTVFAKKLIEFYEFCVSVGIFPKDEVLPPQSHPMTILTPVKQPQSQKDQGAAQPQKKTVQGDRTSTMESDLESGDTGTSDAHSGQIGVIDGYIEQIPLPAYTDIHLKELYDDQTTMLDTVISTFSEQIVSRGNMLRGLFTPDYKDSPIIQNKYNIINFFNPYRIQDQVLFKERKRTYLNVAIFRDISGSVSHTEWELMGEVIDLLMHDIPLEVTYYLYSSGKISIIEVPYIKWTKELNVPQIYKDNPLYKQLRGGTNSDAIGDVIEKQFSENWLNIILTDGDLNALFRRKDLDRLLDNVFIINIGGILTQTNRKVHYYNLKSVKDIPDIYTKLSNVGLD